VGAVVVGAGVGGAVVVVAIEVVVESWGGAVVSGGSSAAGSGPVLGVARPPQKPERWEEVRGEERELHRLDPSVRSSSTTAGRMAAAGWMGAASAAGWLAAAGAASSETSAPSQAASAARRAMTMPMVNAATAIGL
jgi:hypothetical protein